MHTLLLAAALMISPAKADDFGAFFGLQPGDAMALALKQKADFEAERTKQRGWDVFWGRVVEPRYPQKCTFEAVAKKLEVELQPGAEIPPVYFESWDAVYMYNFPEAYRYETGRATDRWANMYMAKMNAIYLVDKGSVYARGATIDDALAREFATYFMTRFKGGDKQAVSDAVQQWYRAEFRRKSPCAAR
jgi:hypothetical protein